MTKWFDTNYHYLVPECWQRLAAFPIESLREFRKRCAGDPRQARAARADELSCAGKGRSRRDRSRYAADACRYTSELLGRLAAPRGAVGAD